MRTNYYTPNFYVQADTCPAIFSRGRTRCC